MVTNIGMWEIVLYTENYALFKPKYILATFSMLATVISQSRRLTPIFNALGEYCDSSGEMPRFGQGNRPGDRTYHIYRQGSVEYSSGFEFQKSVKFEFLKSVAAVCIWSVR